MFPCCFAATRAIAAIDRLGKKLAIFPQFLPEGSRAGGGRRHVQQEPAAPRSSPPLCRLDASLVGIDVGTTATKGLAIDPDGTVLARAEAEYPLSTPRPGWAEQDPEDWWRATQTVLEAPRRRSRRPGRHRAERTDARPRRAGRRRQTVLRPAILWNDQRTQAECDEIEQTIGLERLIALTGNRALTGFTAPKLLWLRHHEPDVYARIKRDRAAQGLRPPEADRRARHRRLRRLGHAPARRRAPQAGAKRS